MSHAAAEQLHVGKRILKYPQIVLSCNGTLDSVFRCLFIAYRIRNGSHGIFMSSHWFIIYTILIKSIGNWGFKNCKGCLILCGSSLYKNILSSVDLPLGQ